MNLRNTFLACAALALCAQSALAVVTTGPGGRGVRVGSSSLIANLDYSDTFTGTDNGGAPNRPYIAALQPAAAYIIESAYGGAPIVNFQTATQPPGIGEFSIASDTAGLVNGASIYPGGSGSGSDFGITQTGGGGVDFGIQYGLRSRYLVQADAVASGDRIDITSSSVPGTIFAGNSLSVFFRGNGTGAVSLYNGTDTPVPNINTGLPNDGQWHNYAALFDQQAKTIQLFVDEQSKGIIDLTTFAGGIYQNFSNAAVGVGAGLAGGQDRIWTDNFQVGEPVAVPEPATIALFGLGALGLFWMRRRGR